MWQGNRHMLTVSERHDCQNDVMWTWNELMAFQVVSFFVITTKNEYVSEISTRLF
jgi:hypothetical protein